MDAVRHFVLGCLPRHAITATGTLSAAAGEGNDGEDRISALPDELLRTIVSRLPIKDAVRTTALSPRWRHIWHSVPLVLYDAHLFPAREPVRVDAIDRVLAGHRGPLRSVRLAYCFFGAHERDDLLDRWARLLAAGGVQDLVFINQPPPLDMSLPVDILRCTELRRLYLGFWRFRGSADLPDSAGVFPHLQEFVVLNTLIDDCDFDHILASSPALETLALVISYGLPKRLRLHGQNLQCVLFWMSTAVELAVADTPRLKRLLMWRTCPPGFNESDDESRMLVWINSAPELNVLGYLDPRVHKLQIGSTVIEADAKLSPSSMVPSVKILALKVNLSVFTEVQMLASFLRCFPNIETLHVESSLDDENETTEHYAEFFEKLSPIECVRSNIKRVVVHEVRGDLCEAAFLKFITQRVDKLEELTLVLADEILVQAGQDLLMALSIPPWASKACTVLLVGPKVDRVWNFHEASDLSILDPFISEHGQEVYRFTKTVE